MDWKKYPAPNLSSDFIDYIVQRILKKQNPFFHIIHITCSEYRRDSNSIKNISEIIEAFERSRKERTKHATKYIEFTYVQREIPSFNKRPVNHTIVFCRGLDDKINDCSNISLIYDPFKYSIRNSIITKLNGIEPHEDIELYTNICFCKRFVKNNENSKKRRFQQDTDADNKQPRPDCVYKAYKKKNTIIYELITLFKENNFQPLLATEIEKKIPSIKFYNYMSWNRRHSQYDLIYKDKDRFALHDSFMLMFRHQL